MTLLNKKEDVVDKGRSWWTSFRRGSSQEASDNPADKEKAADEEQPAPESTPEVAPPEEEAPVEDPPKEPLGEDAV